MKPAGRVCVLVLNHDKRNDLIDCLESVRCLEYEAFDVVVVDNGSSDGSAETVVERFPAMNLVALPSNSGAVEGRNSGLRWAREHLEFDRVLFLDNDTVVMPGLIRRNRNMSSQTFISGRQRKVTAWW